MDHRVGAATAADGYVVSRMTGCLAVTALGNPCRDLGSFPLAQGAAAAILADAGDGASTCHGDRFALDFLAPIEEPSSAHCVTIRRAQLESWLSAFSGARESGDAPCSNRDA